MVIKETRSNSAVINDVEAVRNILDKYAFVCEGPSAVRADDNRGIISFCQDKALPWAILKDYLEFGEDDRDTDELLDEYGKDAFEGLLLELGPYLETPFIVQAIRNSSEWEITWEWAVEPKGNEMRSKEIMSRVHRAADNEEREGPHNTRTMSECVTN